MKRLLLGVVALSLVTTATLAQKVKVEYDQDFDFTAIATYEWVEPPQAAEDPLVHQRIVSAIDYHLSMVGAHKTEGKPDIYVTYAGHSSEEVKVSAPNLGFGYGPGWGGVYGPGGVEASSPTSYTYRQGTLVVLAWEDENKHVILHGTATAVVPKKPEKLESRINKAVKKMFSKWERMAAKGG